MAATNILTTGNTAADSAEITSYGNELFGLKGYTNMDAYVNVSVKDDEGNWHLVGTLNATEPSRIASCPGTYKFSRVAGITCGVFRAA